MKHTFLVSDETVNTYGFRILTDGIDTSRFEKNPIMLYMHETPTIIGRWENLTKKDGKLFADAVFDEADPIAKEVLGKVERGFLKATSLGITFEPQNKLKDDKGDYLSKCILVEISIVSIGSNENALKLYTDNFETVQLKLNALSEINSIAKLFELPNTADQKAVLQVVTTLKAENEIYKLKVQTFETEQEKELKEIIELAVQRNLLSPILQNHFLSVGKQDFYKAKSELISLFPIKTMSFIEQIETHKAFKHKANNLLSGKEKSEWNLEDYRMNAPDELEANPDLFKKLLAESTK